MATIAKTKVGTGNDASICDGFALFPSRPGQRALKLGWDKRGTIFSVNPSISVFKLRASADWTAMAGLCGPGYGWSADFQGSVGSSGLDLTNLQRQNSRPGSSSDSSSSWACPWPSPHSGKPWPAPTHRSLSIRWSGF